MRQCNRAFAFVVMLSFVVMTMAGCSFTYKTVKGSQIMANSNKINSDNVYNVIAGVLISEGFDVKMANKEIGVITTEWKQYGRNEHALLDAYSHMHNLPRDESSDLYLQLKIRITKPVDESKNMQVSITPLSKKSNITNPAYFEEKPLKFFDEQMQKEHLGAYRKIELNGYLVYMNIVSKIAEACGIDVGDIKHNIEMYEEKL